MNIYSITRGGSTDTGGRGVEIVPRGLGLPGIHCVGEAGSCGNTWADGSVRVPFEPPRGTCEAYRFGKIVDAHTYLQMREDMRSVLGLPVSTPLPPGTKCGRLRVRYSGLDVMPFEWVTVFCLVTNNAASAAIGESGLTGGVLYPVEIEGKYYGVQPPSELSIIGKGGRAISDPPVEVLSSCPVCGRLEFKKTVYHGLRLDPEAWDGSDIFRFEPPFNGYTFVTQRWIDSLAPFHLEGLAYRSVNELLELRRQVTV